MYQSALAGAQHGRDAAKRLCHNSWALNARLFKVRLSMQWYNSTKRLLTDRLVRICEGTESA